MYLKCSVRRKSGKERRSWSIVENRRVPGGQSVQRHVLYLGEIDDSQEAAWQKASRCGKRASAVPQIQLRLDALRLHRPRQWGACWLALELWRELGLELFWRDRLAP